MNSKFFESPLVRIILAILFVYLSVSWLGNHIVISYSMLDTQGETSFTFYSPLDEAGYWKTHSNSISTNTDESATASGGITIGIRTHPNQWCFMMLMISSAHDEYRTRQVWDLQYGETEDMWAYIFP